MKTNEEYKQIQDNICKMEGLLKCLDNSDTFNDNNAEEIAQTEKRIKELRKLMVGAKGYTIRLDRWFVNNIELYDLEPYIWFDKKECEDMLKKLTKKYPLDKYEMKEYEIH